VLSIEGARAKANEYLDQAKRGDSPVTKLEAAAAANGMTVEALAQRFPDDDVPLKPRRAIPKYEGAIATHIVPKIGRELADNLSGTTKAAMCPARAVVAIGSVASFASSVACSCLSPAASASSCSCRISMPPTLC
jgi:hypothetical protein